MAKVTKVVLHFDDGTTYDVPADTAGSIFLKEAKAVKCGHNPPYGKPPKKGEPAVLAAAGTGGSGGSGGTGEASLMGETCYMVNGVIVCP